ncbi:hypothetical protein N7468_008617 [Penicillium chermesinum]|uniref:HMG box domain-containing protein n=1 Tax=Penicillium chermesinum TaxID=63820 RepID=A0A9W9TK18_9EURO|nr:uncharacterized protein N7468_008617 [Penicillium chermesinum]KAJ5224075.1 hypothetical protein N7468_008617 [Penicillium chermesinum]
MSWDRVLPAPAGLHYETSQVRPSDLLDHKIMNDSPKLHDRLVYRPDVKYTDLCANAVSQMHQHLNPYNQQKSAAFQTDPMDVRGIKQGPVIATKGISRSSSSSGSGSSSPTKSVKERDSFCLCQPDPKVPRPRNAFILYRQHYQAQVVAHNPGMANPDISKIIGGQWRSLSDEEKAKWRELAEEEKIRHNQQYPGYRYQPRRSGRDGGPRSAGSGINNNPSGGTHCARCGGRFMHPPSPVTPFTPSVSPEYRSPNFQGAGQSKSRMMSASSACAMGRDPTEPKLFDMRAGKAFDTRVRPHSAEDISSPEIKRRRVSDVNDPIQSMHRDRSPGSYPQSYSARLDVHPRAMGSMVHAQHQYGPPQLNPHPDPSLKLPPLQTVTPVMTPATPLKLQDSSVEATVMTIPFLNKIKVLAKISPPLSPSFHTIPQSRGPVIAIEGQDPHLVQIAVEHIDRLLKRETKYHVRIFEGPELRTPRPSSAENGTTDTTAEYLTKISAWHSVSEKIVHFVKSVPAAPNASLPSRASPEVDTKSTGSLSPKTLVPQTANMNIHSPAHSSENSSEGKSLYARSLCLHPGRFGSAVSADDC